MVVPSIYTSTPVCACMIPWPHVPTPAGKTSLHHPFKCERRNALHVTSSTAGVHQQPRWFLLPLLILVPFATEFLPMLKIKSNYQQHRLLWGRYYLAVETHIFWKMYERKLVCELLHLIGAPEWRSELRHCISVQEVSLQTLVSHPAVIGSPIGRRTIGPASSGFGRCRPSL